jgi:hypothetical protein
LNRARRVRLVKNGLSDLVDVVLELQLPETYGAPASELTLTLDIVAGTGLREHGSRISSDQRIDHEPWRLSVPRLRALVTALLATLVDPEVVKAVGEIAGVDPLVLPQPPSLAFRSKPDVKDLLETEGLSLMIDRGISHGADAVAIPHTTCVNTRILMLRLTTGSLKSDWTPASWAWSDCSNNLTSRPVCCDPQGDLPAQIESHRLEPGGLLP